MRVDKLGLEDVDFGHCKKSPLPQKAQQKQSDGQSKTKNRSKIIRETWLFLCQASDAMRLKNYQIRSESGEQISSHSVEEGGFDRVKRAGGTSVGGDVTSR